MASRLAAALLGLLILTGAALPEKGPLPDSKPAAITTPSGPVEGETIPVPDPKPSSGRPPAAAPARTETNPASLERPQPPIPGLRRTEAASETPVIEIESEEEFRTCRAALEALGTEFRIEAPIDDGKGCGMNHPITVTALLPGIRIAPEATLRCETALKLARLTRDVILPATRIALPEKGDLTAIDQASAYVCRNRNSAETGKISEHARGNAVDVASLQFGKETVPMMIAKPEDGTLAAAFQRSLNAAACLYFSTVLSPGSDEAHKDHLHLDVLERRDGYRYCR